MSVVRYVPSDSKQEIRMNLVMKLIRINLDMKLIYCMLLGIYKYIYLIQSIHMGVVRPTWAFQKYFSISNLQYIKNQLIYNTDFLHMGRLQHEQLIAGEIFKILVGGLKILCLLQNFMAMNCEFF